ncbi:MAG TPA: aminomethyltransferase beta-barrel domain-containing protein, partial [Afifellaceae bacterium]|nr:aminomethyltransferase beta-barrel domain-containing protein [Afifellaceae bacterium]
PLSALPAEGLPVHARVRSSRPPAPAILSIDQGETVVRLAEHETGVAPGQACVLYDGEGPEARVLGGGTIAAEAHAPAHADAA